MFCVSGFFILLFLLPLSWTEEDRTVALSPCSVLYFRCSDGKDSSSSSSFAIISQLPEWILIEFFTRPGQMSLSLVLWDRQMSDRRMTWNWLSLWFCYSRPYSDNIFHKIWFVSALYFLARIIEAAKRPEYISILPWEITQDVTAERLWLAVSDLGDSWFKSWYWAKTVWWFCFCSKPTQITWNQAWLNPSAVSWV